MALSVFTTPKKQCIVLALGVLSLLMMESLGVKVR